MLARAADDDGTHCIGVIDPLKNVDDFLPEGGVHRVDLLGAIDLDVGDVIGQVDLEGAVRLGFEDQLVHGRHSCRGRVDDAGC
ncbi:hypothetical protein D3C81_1459040 [compost metagenome]